MHNIKEFSAEAGMKKDDQPRVQHTRRQNKFLTNYLVTSTLGQNNGNDNMSNRNIQLYLKLHTKHCIVTVEL